MPIVSQRVVRSSVQCSFMTTTSTWSEVGDSGSRRAVARIASAFCAVGDDGGVLFQAIGVAVALDGAERGAQIAADAGFRGRRGEQELLVGDAGAGTRGCHSLVCAWSTSDEIWIWCMA